MNSLFNYTEQMDKLGDMDLFVSVVRSGGLGTARLEVSLSPASVGARINGLEKRHDTRFSAIRRQFFIISVRFGTVGLQTPVSTAALGEHFAC
ncbi:MAG: hypothetical protein V3U65_15135 [Granulosicoccaceae bacterium]